MKTLIIGDIHLNEKSIPEVKGIFDEIIMINADKVIQLGDFYDNHRPTPKELDYGTGLIKILKNKYKFITIISGTGIHDILNNESIIKYLSWLDVRTVKGDYISDNILYGHFMLNESKLEYGSGRCSAKDLAKYTYVFLGHQHSPQKINNIYHVPSIRYVNFSEVMDKEKHVILLEDNKLTFIPLKSPIPMVDVHTIEELDKLPEKTKVRLVINSFDYFKKVINCLPKYDKKFHTFAFKPDFQIVETKTEVKKSTKAEGFEQSLDTYLKTNKVNVDIQKILRENLK